MFQEKGYAQTRLSDIARKAETQAGSIYYHFASREAIVAEVLEVANARTVECVRERLDRLPPDASVRDRIEAAVQGHLGLVLSGDPFTRAHMRIFDQIPKNIRDHFLGVLDEYADVWRTLFEDARKAGQFRSDIDLSVARLLLLGMLNWAVEWYRPGRLSVEQIGHQVTALFLDGISAPERE
ncbi:hypothetical protein MB02_14440 [Croceicoccus estronivorus]|nr:hypothetical protein MB02_14440 [Croceicoccus estronivorus]